MSSEFFFHGGGDFSKGGPLPGGLHGACQQISFSCTGANGERVERLLHGFVIASGPDGAQPCYLRPSYGGMIYFQHIDRFFFRQFEPVDADDHVFPGIDARLFTSRGFFDTGHRNACFDSPGHAAGFFDFFYQRPCATRQPIGQCFHIIRSAQRIDCLDNIRFLLQINLCITCNAGGILGG